MTKKELFEELAYEESGLKSHWIDILRYIKRDLAYIWSDDVKRDLASIRGELEKIKYILKKLSSYYKKDKTFMQEHYNITALINYLDQVEASKKWVRGAYKGLRGVIKFIDKGKIGFRQYRGDLHTHSQSSINGVPISGSNC
jgi:hypothetical protein